MKYIFVELKVTCGEYEFHCPHTHYIEDDQTIEEYAEDYASTFYPLDEDEKAKAEDGGWYFNAGEIFVEIYRRDYITEEQYKTLTLFV